MIAIGVILIIFGVLTCGFGVLQNTYLFMVFADVGAQLARFNSETGFNFTWLFVGPGLIAIIIGIVIIITGIIFIIKGNKNRYYYVYDDDNSDEIISAEVVDIELVEDDTET